MTMMKSSIMHNVLLVLISLVVAFAAAETFHFEIMDPELSDCDDETLLELHLKSFNLQCIDGFGCERGAGVLGAAARE